MVALTGVDAAVSMKLIADSPPVTNKAEPAAAAPAKPKFADAGKNEPPKVKGPSPLRIRNDVDPEQDAFVQQVVHLFDATVVRVTDAPVRRDVPDEDT